MKKFATLFLAVCLACVVVFSCLTFVGCSNKVSVNDLTIKNFSKYSSLVVGKRTTTQNGKSATKVGVKGKAKPVDTNSKDLNQLLGVVDDNIEQIEFIEEADNFTKNYGISMIYHTGNFTLIDYTKDYSGEVMNTPDMNDPDYRFLLYNKTGKMFNINSFRYYYLGASDDSVFFRGSELGDAASVFKLTPKDNLLEVKEIFNHTQINAFTYMEVDKFGNVFSLTSSSSGYCDWLLTAEGTLKKVDARIQFAANGIMYCGKKWFTKDGEIEEASFVPNDFTNLLRECKLDVGILQRNNYEVYSEDNVIYCWNWSNSQLYDNNNTVVKYEFLDDIRYEIEFIKLENISADTQYLIMNDRIYFLKNNEIYYSDIKDGSSHTLTSDYLFNAMEADNYGNIIFEGVDTKLNSVIGTIDYEGNITVGVTPMQYEVLYIQSMN